MWHSYRLHYHITNTFIKTVKIQARISLKAKELAFTGFIFAALSLCVFCSNQEPSFVFSNILTGLLFAEKRQKLVQKRRKKCGEKSRISD